MYGKLVRDKVVAILEGEGKKPVYRTLGPQEIGRELLYKLVEEANEVLSATDEEMYEEIADLLEVLIAIIRLRGMSLRRIAAVQEEKFNTKGGFEKRFFLEAVKEAA